jgi:hypothetical protein
MLFSVIIAVVCENHKGDTNKLTGENAQLVNVTTFDTYGNNICWARSLQFRWVVHFIVTDVLRDECIVVWHCTLLRKYMSHILISITPTSTVNANHNSFVG